MGSSNFVNMRDNRGVEKRIEATIFLFANSLLKPECILVGTRILMMYVA